MQQMAARLAVCLLNISEAHQAHVVDRIANAAAMFGQSSEDLRSNFKCSSTVLNVFSDYDYNRSVLTIAALIDNLQTSVVNACKVAYREINLKDHIGGHPRLGSVDLIPIYPISPLVSLEECGDIAKGIGNQIVSEVLGTSVFYFGTADCPNTRGLVQRRKEVGWYNGRHDDMSYDGVRYDMGEPPTSRYGLTGVGVSPYVMNCNITIKTNNLQVGKTIARAIRGANPGGLKGVQAMAFDHQGSVEIACNVEAFVSDQPRCDNRKEHAFNYAKPNEIKERIKMLASEYDIGVKSAAIVGFTPEEVYDLAYQALSKGNTMAWKNSCLHRM